MTFLISVTLAKVSCNDEKSTVLLGKITEDFNG